MDWNVNEQLNNHLVGDKVGKDLECSHAVFETCGRTFGSFLEACLAADEYAVQNVEVVQVFAVTPMGHDCVYTSDGIQAKEEMEKYGD